MLDYSILSNNFTQITNYKKDIENILLYIKHKIDSLSDIYDEYCSMKSDSFNIKTLDTFKFQNKLIIIEYDSNTKIYKIFMNRMYGDYYKLFIDIMKYCNSNVPKLKMNVSTDYEIYKDLEVEKEYSYDVITDLYSEMLSIITDLDNYISNENRNITEYQLNKNNGINISSFVLDKEYSLNTIENKSKMFYNTLLEFTNFQIKTLRRILLKLRVFYTQINSDIQLENGIYKKGNSNNNPINKIEKLNKRNNRSISFNLRDKLSNEIIDNENNSDSDSDNSKIENLINEEINKIFNQSNSPIKEIDNLNISKIDNLDIDSNDSINTDLSNTLSSLQSIDLTEINEGNNESNESKEENNVKIVEENIKNNFNDFKITPKRITNKLMLGGFFLPLI